MYKTQYYNNRQLMETPKSQKQQGTQQFHLKNYQKAIQLYRQYIKQEHDDNLAAMLNIALCYFKLNQYQSAINVCDQLLTIDQTYYKCYYRRIMCRKQIINNQPNDMGQKYRLWFDCGMFVKYGQKKGVDKEIQELQALAKKIKEEIRVCQAKKLITFQRDLLEIEKNEIKQLAESEMQAIYRKQCQSELEEVGIKIDEVHKQMKDWIKKQKNKQQGKQKIEKYKNEIKQLLKIKKMLMEQQQKRKNSQQKQNKKQENNYVHQQQKGGEKQEVTTAVQQSGKEQSEICKKQTKQSEICKKEIKQQKCIQNIVVSQMNKQQENKNKVQPSLAELQTSQKLQSNAWVIPGSVPPVTKTQVQVHKSDTNSSTQVTQTSQINANIHLKQQQIPQTQQNRPQQQQKQPINKISHQKSQKPQNNEPKTCQIPPCQLDHQTLLFPSQCSAQQLWSKHIKQKIQNTRDRHKVFSQILLQILTDSNIYKQIKQKLVTIIAQKLVDLKILLRSTDKLVKDNIVEEVKKLGVTEQVRRKYG